MVSDSVQFVILQIEYSNHEVLQEIQSLLLDFAKFYLVVLALFEVSIRVQDIYDLDNALDQLSIILLVPVLVHVTLQSRNVTQP